MKSLNSMVNTNLNKSKKINFNQTKIDFIIFIKLIIKIIIKMDDSK
jgi:hypothetical protein